jgi:diaminohydroxyphosphoribosylaminopyrimidine deaminase/5-amino-6-(5-phosphoribosylamino)uracil reductase
LTAREYYRERPLTRVVFDRRLRTPPSARLFSTLSAGPAIILTTAGAIARDPERVEALQRVGATLVAPEQPGVGPAVAHLATLGIQSLLIEGGNALHGAAWDAGIVDYVQLYVAPHALGPSGVPLEGRAFPTVSLFDRRIALVGPDVIIEGYVHRPD